MPNYGLKIINANLQTQIDSVYKNYILHEHGENVTTSGTAPTPKTATITFATPISQPPLIAIKPSSSYYCGWRYYTKSGDNYTGFVVNSEYDSAATFDWQSFIPTASKSGENYGLRVYDVSTNLLFDSGFRQMRIKDVDTCSPAYNAVSSISHPSDSNAYFIMSPWGGWEVYYGWNGMYCLLDGYIGMFKYIDATTVSFGGRNFLRHIIGAEISSSQGYWPSVWTILTIGKEF